MCSKKLQVRETIVDGHLFSSFVKGCRLGEHHRRLSVIYPHLQLFKTNANQGISSMGSFFFGDTVFIHLYTILWHVSSYAINFGLWLPILGNFAQCFAASHFPFSLRRSRPAQLDFNPGGHSAVTFILMSCLFILSFLCFEARNADAPDEQR